MPYIKQQEYELLLAEKKAFEDFSVTHIIQYGVIQQAMDKQMEARNKLEEAIADIQGKKRAFELSESKAKPAPVPTDTRPVGYHYGNISPPTGQGHFNWNSFIGMWCFWASPNSVKSKCGVCRQEQTCQKGDKCAFAHPSRGDPLKKDIGAGNIDPNICRIITFKSQKEYNDHCFRMKEKLHNGWNWRKDAEEGVYGVQTPSL